MRQRALCDLGQIDLTDGETPPLVLQRSLYLADVVEMRLPGGQELSRHLLEPAILAAAGISLEEIDSFDMRLVLHLDYARSKSPQRRRGQR